MYRFQIKSRPSLDRVQTRLWKSLWPLKFSMDFLDSGTRDPFNALRSFLLRPGMTHSSKKTVGKGKWSRVGRYRLLYWRSLLSRPLILWSAARMRSPTTAGFARRRCLQKAVKSLRRSRRSFSTCYISSPTWASLSAIAIVHQPC